MSELRCVAPDTDADARNDTSALHTDADPCADKHSQVKAEGWRDYNLWHISSD